MDTAVFDESGRILLIERADNHLWAMPGGACEVGDTPAENAAREVWEETGYRVEITRLLGIFDNSRRLTAARRHGYLLLFGGKVVGARQRSAMKAWRSSGSRCSDPLGSTVARPLRSLAVCRQVVRRAGDPALF